MSIFKRSLALTLTAATLHLGAQSVAKCIENMQRYTQVGNNLPKTFIPSNLIEL